MTQKPIFYTVIFVVLLVVGVLFLWLPQYTDFSNTRAELSAKNVELQNKQEYFLKLQGLSQKLQEHQQELAKVKAGIPSQADTSDTLNFIAATGSQNGLILRNVNIEKTVRVEEWSDIMKTSVEVVFSGTYPAFKNFLTELQSSSKLIGVEEISFKQPEQGEIFTFNLKARMHSY